MKRVPLADTLTALIQAVEPPEQSGLRVMEAEFDLPLEVFATVADGRLVLHAAPPYTRWRSGVEPTIHRGRLTARMVPNHRHGRSEAPDPVREGTNDGRQ